MRIRHTDIGGMTGACDEECEVAETDDVVGLMTVDHGNLDR